MRNDVELFYKIIFSRKRQHRYTEEMMLGGVICPIILIRHLDLYIYGCGADTYNLISYFRYIGIEPKYIFDADESKCGKLCDDIQVVSARLISQYISNPKNAFVVVNVFDPMGLTMASISSVLHEAGIVSYYIIKHSERANIDVHCSWADKARIEYYRSHANELIEVYSMFSDKDSRDTIKEYIRTYTECGYYLGKQCDSRYKYFYGIETDGDNNELLYSHRSDEVWLNCGSNVGDTILTYISLGFDFKKIYAVEADPVVFKMLLQNIDMLPNSIREKIEPVNEYISEDNNVQSLINDHLKGVSLINADIEGAEQTLLTSLSSLIKKERPVLAICAYHRADDLVLLPRIISNMVDDYIYKLRKYESSINNTSRTSELVLYAIPKERDVT